MADTKISALAAATALDGTEALPVVQGAATVAATVDQIKDRATFLARAAGVLPNGSDMSAALSALLSTVYSAGGGTIVFDRGTYTLASNIVLPNDSATPRPSQPPIVFVGAGSQADGSWVLTNPVGGTTLLFTGTGGQAHVDTRGTGYFGVRDLTLRVGANTGLPIIMTARTYYELGEYFHIDFLRQQARVMNADDRWSSEALEALTEQLYSCQAGLTMRVMNDMRKAIKAGKCGDTKGSILKAWIPDHGHQADLMAPLLNEFRKSGTIALPMLIIAEQRLRALHGG